MKTTTLAALSLLGLAAPAHAQLPSYVTKPVKAVFQKAAELKGDRVFHADGVAYRATITDKRGQHEGIVRVSRGGADSKTRPDILGLAVKAKGQDYLMVTALGKKGIAANLPAFRSSLAGKTMSSLTPFEAQGKRGVLTTTLPADFTSAIDDKPNAARGDKSFQIALNSGKGRDATSTKIADVTVHLGEKLSDAQSQRIHMTPFHERNGVKPVGVVNELRKAAYEGSQAGRAIAAAKKAQQ